MKAYLRVFRWHSKQPDPNQPALVYQMRCPLTDDIVYIGYTINFEKRCTAHLKGCGWNTKKGIFIKDMLWEGLTPKFEIIKHLESIREAKAYEKEMIQQLKPRLNSKL